MKFVGWVKVTDGDVIHDSKDIVCHAESMADAFDTVWRIFSLNNMQYAQYRDQAEIRVREEQEAAE